MSEPSGSVPPDHGGRAPEADGAGLAGYVREAWSQALIAMGDTSDEVQKILGKVAGWVEVGPEEARRLAVELTEKLKRERSELESTVEAAVRRALSPFRLPSRDEVSALEARLERVAERVERLLAKQQRSS